MVPESRRRVGGQNGLRHEVCQVQNLHWADTKAGLESRLWTPQWPQPRGKQEQL